MRHDNEHTIEDAEQPVVLLVDDEEAIVDLLQNFFEDAGFGVLKANNGREALELVRHHPVDIVLTDVMMPQMDGAAFCETVRSDPKTAHVPVLAMSATHVPDAKSGFTAFIPKPFDCSEVIATISAFLSGYRATPVVMPPPRFCA